MKTDDTNLGSQRPVVILGGTGGIGSSTARLLCGQGVPVVVVARNEARLQAMSEEPGITAIAADVRHFEEVDRVMREVGPISGAVNCVGSILLKPAHLTTQDELEETLRLNLFTAFGLVRSAVRNMPDGGSLVLMSSCAAGIGLANHEAISAAKCGVEGLIRSSAASYASRQIRVNGIAPGLVETPLSERITSNAGALRASVEMHPLGRIGTATEVAQAISWLLSGSTSWMTGQVIGLDGGLAATRVRSQS